MLRCVVVLAGGSSRRLGRDKVVEDLDGRSVLDRLLDGLDGAAPGVPVLVVGPRRRTERQVRWVQEDPPAGGPVAGIGCALDALGGPPEGLVAVVAGDQPFAGAAVAVLASVAERAARSCDGVLADGGDGRSQPLLAVYRVGPLRAALGAEPAARAGRSVRSVVAGLRVDSCQVPAPSTLDVDTEQDVAAARALVRDAGHEGAGSGAPS